MHKRRALFRCGGVLGVQLPSVIGTEFAKSCQLTLRRQMAQVLGLIAQPSKYQFDFATLSKSGYTELSIKGGHSCDVAA